MQRFHLIQLLSMISPCVPISFIDHFYHDIDVCDVLLLLFKPRCAYFWMLSLLGPALARQEHIYSGTVNTGML